ncbi:methyl-accepting chemotaxis protein [Brachyspira suanatina]|uniref:Methyl-accepting chemotaxis protein n=1 Tax=Brachyspira suanatina TaxID=381802 RepID=A0A0G4K8P4_9SPIR|nr:methyl-accepting chemotaxis protein [Brachyspira suanatina]CRF33925.1 methyl-accepting chemotaxis protein [Brachyspira suanatina]
MFKKFGLQFRISLLILSIFFAMIIVSSLVNIILVNNANRAKSLSYLKKSVEAESYRGQNILKIELNYLNELASSLEDLYNIGIRDRNTYLNVVSNCVKKDEASIIAMGFLFNKDLIDNDADYTNNEFYRDIKGQFGVYLSKNNGNVIQQKFAASELNADYFVNAKTTLKPYITPLYSYNIAGNNIDIYTWSVPIFDNSGKNIGVVVADVTPQSLGKSIEKIKPYAESKVILFDTAGNLVYNAGRSDGIGKNGYEVYEWYKTLGIIEKVHSGESLNFEHFTTVFNEVGTYVVSPINMLDGYNWGIEILTPSRVIQAETRYIRNTMILILVFILIVSLIITPIIIKKKVSNIIILLAKDIVAMSTGDLTIEIPKGFEKRTDEWGDIARGWGKAMSNFNNVINTVKHSAEQVSTAANEVLIGNNDLSQRTETQASSLEETAASMNEMASAIKESAESVAQSTSMVSDAKESLNKAGTIIEDSVNKMNDVYESSSKIMDITKLIEGIAFQTNILALNASVEAARAGDQGRGFAVVASEVRNLAQNTQESVKSITSLITDSNDKIKLAANSVQESQSIFNEILEKMDRASSIMDRINIAAQEQEKGIDQVNIAISNMDASVQKNAALVSEATSASESLLSEANDLLKAISYFNLKD